MKEMTLSNQEQQRRIRHILIVSVLYIAMIIYSNLGSLRILAVGALAVDGGTLLYPFTFTMRDVLHKKAGKSIAQLVILLSAAVNLALFAFVWLVSVLPADPTAGDQSAYALVLTPGFRLVIGSIAASTIAEWIDTQVYARVYRRYGKKKQWLRVLASNGVSIPIDTLIFLLIAFYGRYPLPVLVSMFWMNLIIKYLVSSVSFGSVYLVKDDRA
ncbi:MAG: queuosine precursor transporter [Firmicutes bacterium]|nr:queuosine precursor transporter [Bacillota bacterium]